MKKILTMFLTFIMLFSLCIPAFAFDSSYLWDDVVPADILNNSPNIYNNGINNSSCPDCVYGNADYSIMFYYNDTYYLAVAHGLSYGATFYIYSGDNILRLNKSDNSKFTVFKFNSDTKLWETEKSSIELYDLTGYKFVKKRSNVNFTIDDKLFNYDGSNIIYDNSNLKKIDFVTFTGPNRTEYFINDTFDKTGVSCVVTYVDGSTEDVTSKVWYNIADMTTAGMNKSSYVYYKNYVYEFTINVSEQIIIDPDIPPVDSDTVNKNIFDSISDFFCSFFKNFKDVFIELFGGLFDLVLFIIDLLEQLCRVLLELPKLLTNLLGLQDELFKTLNLFFVNNNKASSISALAFVAFGIAIVNVFLKLFGGSKLGGD